MYRVCLPDASHGMTPAGGDPEVRQCDLEQVNEEAVAALKLLHAIEKALQRANHWSVGTVIQHALFRTEMGVGDGLIDIPASDHEREIAEGDIPDPTELLRQCGIER